MDSQGYHSLTCLEGGYVGIRHNALRDELLHACKSACLNPGRETPFLLPGSDQRPADVFLRFFEKGQPACLDLACIHTQQPKYIKYASVETGAATDRYEVDVKEEKE